MIISSSDPDPWGTFLYLERYVNRGSPSGFSAKYTTSAQTSAKGSEAGYYACSATFPSNIEVRDFGDNLLLLAPNQLVVHPDMMAEDVFKSAIEVSNHFAYVVPTASERTVRDATSGWFYKLAYKGLIGRVERTLGTPQVSSAIEVTNIISEMGRAGKLPKAFSFMREPFGRVFRLGERGGIAEWGCVLREPFPSPKIEDFFLLLPGFSLFSPDDHSPNDPLILHQLIDGQTKTPVDFLFENIISPVYRAYFELLLNSGLQLEAHAQNILFALDRELRVVSVVARDAESIDKDISLIDELQLPVRISDNPYKRLDRSQYNYHIMHSFMFDFKLGEYLISPLIEAARLRYDFDLSLLLERICDFTARYIGQLPKDFFPSDGMWYSYANVVHDRNQQRPYLANPSPKFRRS